MKMLGPDKDEIPVDTIFLIADLIGDRIFICRPNDEKVSWAEIEEFVEVVVDNTGNHEPHLSEENDLLIYEFDNEEIAGEVFSGFSAEAKEQRMLSRMVENELQKLAYVLFR